MAWQSDTLTLTVNNQVPDSSKVSFSAIRFILNICGKEKAIFLAAGNSGGLLAFEDSQLKKPLILEKRSGFQFRTLKAGQTLKLVYTCRPGPGNYLGFRLMEEVEKGKTLDEVVWCCPDYAADCFYSAFYGWLEVK